MEEAMENEKESKTAAGGGQVDAVVMPVRYFLHPGEMKSKNDGDIHYITAPQLARLYGLDYKKCHVIYDDRPETRKGLRAKPGDVHLYPKYNENYSLT